jgi:hypothetical protein
MRGAWRRGGALAAGLLACLAGCSSDTSYALVSVLSAGGAFNDVAQLVVDVDNGSYHDTLSYPKTVGGTTYRFDETAPLTFSVSYRASSHSGTLDVGVTTLDASGARTGFGTGTAAITSGVTKVSVTVTRGAEPPAQDAGADGPNDAKRDLGPSCDPGEPATACGGNQTCIVGCKADGGTAGMCVASGNKPPGALCNADCTLGSECFNFECGSGTPIRTCLRLCKNDGECAPGRCNTVIPCGTTPTSYRACSQACDPVGAAVAGCAAGLRCFMYTGEVTNCDCPGVKRTGVDGTPCDNSDTCRAGFFCITTAGTKTCRPLCRLDSPQCDPGLTCTKLVDPDFTIYGACLP